MFVARCSALAVIALLGLAVADPTQSAPQSDRITSDACTSKQTGPLWENGTYLKQITFETVPNGDRLYHVKVPADVCGLRHSLGTQHIATVVTACNPDGYPPVVVMNDVEEGTVYISGPVSGNTKVKIAVYCRPTINPN